MEAATGSAAIPQTKGAVSHASTRCYPAQAQGQGLSALYSLFASRAKRQPLNEDFRRTTFPASQAHRPIDSPIATTSGGIDNGVGRSRGGHCWKDPGRDTSMVARQPEGASMAHSHPSVSYGPAKPGQPSPSRVRTGQEADLSSKGTTIIASRVSTSAQETLDTCAPEACTTVRSLGHRLESRLKAFSGSDTHACQRVDIRPLMRREYHHLGASPSAPNPGAASPEKPLFLRFKRARPDSDPRAVCARTALGGGPDQTVTGFQWQARRQRRHRAVLWPATALMSISRGRRPSILHTSRIPPERRHGQI